MRIRLAVPDAAVGPDTLDAALEAVTRTNEVLLDKGVVPTATEAIKRGIKWRPEPPGDEHFDHAKTVVDRGHGDCDDLAPYHAASLRHTGEDPDARAIVRRSGKHRWHAIVERSDGSIDDPSADAGMYEYKSPLQPRLAGPQDRPAMATKLIELAGNRKLWCARCDLPFRNGRGYAISGHGISTERDLAASNAIEGALTVGIAGELAHGRDVLKLSALKDLLDGCDPEQVRDRLYAVAGQEGVGFFGSLMKPFKSIAKVAMPIAKVAMPVTAFATDHAFKHPESIPVFGKAAAAAKDAATRAGVFDDGKKGPPRTQAGIPRGAPTTVRKEGEYGPRIFNFY